MAIQTLSDVNRAFDEGRWHFQRFQKNAGTAHATQWADCTFASGQPAYDAHVGTPLEFTPCIAQKNDAIWFPGISPDHKRYLSTATIWTNQATYNGPINVQFFDLVGYYPLIDGDSTDPQALDNTQALPRYSDGKGVRAVLVNHIAPGLQNGLSVIDYTDSDGVNRGATVDIPNLGQNLVVSGSRNTVGAVPSTFVIPLPGNGIRSINTVTHSVAPGGLHCIYLIKPLGSMVLGENLLTAEKEFFLENCCRLPEIPDGAWIGWFDMLSTGTTARTVTWFGGFTFIWG